MQCQPNSNNYELKKSFELSLANTIGIQRIQDLADFKLRTMRVDTDDTMNSDEK